ncbi:glyoxalase superfamily protein [Micromonospora maritima]|uniref:Glyoxalase superfamily protein n=1 Tax=Micromonospora maritima TaxID=986711 RepID=A0ABW7ZTD4_9ACTN
MTERLAPILRVRDADAAATWFSRLGFARLWEHRFAPDLPRYVGIGRPGMEIHLSEHARTATGSGSGPCRPEWSYWRRRASASASSRSFSASAELIRERWLNACG